MLFNCATQAVELSYPGGPDGTQKFDLPKGTNMNPSMVLIPENQRNLSIKGMDKPNEISLSDEQGSQLEIRVFHKDTMVAGENHRNYFYTVGDGGYEFPILKKEHDGNGMCALKFDNELPAETKRELELLLMDLGMDPLPALLPNWGITTIDIC